MRVLPERTGVSSLPCGFGLSSLRHHCPRGLLGTSEMMFCLRMSQGCRLIGRRHCVMEDIGLTRAELGQRSEWMSVLRDGPRDAFPWVICRHAFAHGSVFTEFLLCKSSARSCNSFKVVLQPGHTQGGFQEHLTLESPTLTRLTCPPTLPTEPEGRDRSGDETRKGFISARPAWG